MRWGPNSVHTINIEWATTSKHVECMQFCNGMAPVEKEFWHIGCCLVCHIVETFTFVIGRLGGKSANQHGTRQLFRMVRAWFAHACGRTVLVVLFGTKICSLIKHICHRPPCPQARWACLIYARPLDKVYEGN